MDIFSASPRSFKVHRKSHAALRLKSFISRELRQFLADYRDDVLAEYITVLICNGKHQYQAKEDLEAFLGNRTVEFVSWLWNLILKKPGQSSTDSGFLYLDEIAAVSPQDSDKCKGASTDRCEDFQSYSTGHDELVMKYNMTYQVSTCDPISSEDVKLAEGSQHCPSFSAPLSEVNTKKGLSRTCSNGILRRTIATENINREILNQESRGLPKELLPLPKREAVPENARFLMSGTGSLRSEKPRGSVWDRLGKPCEDISLGHTSVDFYGVGHKKQDGKVHNQLALIPPKRNPEASALGQRSYGYPVETEKVEHGGSAVGKPHTANNIGRKRLFGELSTDPGTSSVSLVHERNMYPQCKNISQDFKKSNLTKNGLKTTQSQEVLDVKQRLHQIEMEMSKLHSKQLAMEKKDGKMIHLLNSGILKYSENNIEVDARTVLVTNFYDNSIIRTAYVTFASKESVDKAVALSGTTFYSRTVKVLRKAEAASAATAPAQVSAKTFDTHVPHGNRKVIPNKPRYLRSSLQWRREPSIDPTEAEPPSAPASVEGNQLGNLSMPFLSRTPSPIYYFLFRMDV
ncbi:RNA binding RRM/RBD/RNP motifs family protein, partial [Prunus dulcis]